MAQLAAQELAASDETWREVSLSVSDGTPLTTDRGCQPAESLEAVRRLRERCGGSFRIRGRPADNPAVLRDLLTQARCRLLIVDQFEELFTSCADADDRRVFIQAPHARLHPRTRSTRAGMPPPRSATTAAGRR
ncbi:hypothetical protein [Nonomuraea sp. NPDC050786]|uniref:nSTAND1 domain-containing NTPase n=1 Tax=Nonomuraea sp. NPDC050786 TaxID=3154840 RepID=UPI0033C784ED